MPISTGRKEFFGSRLALPLTVLISLFSFLGNSYAQIGDPDTITFDSSIVILNAVVTDSDGKVVGGLTESDFHLREDNTPQSIDFVESASTPYAAVILLDISGSMAERVSLARSAAIRFLSGIRPGDSVAIYSFHSKVELVQDFSHSRDLRSRVFDLKASGYTALNDAVLEASKVLQSRDEKRRAIIVLSDGADTRSRVSASKALKAAQNANATIYTVDMSAIAGAGRGRRQNTSVLKRFARKTGGVFLKTPGGIELRKAFANIVRELGVLYTIGYHSTNDSPDGKWREIELASKDGYEIRTRDGYYAIRKPPVK